MSTSLHVYKPFQEGASYVGESGQNVSSNETPEYKYWKNDRMTSGEDVEMTVKHGQCVFAAD